MYTATIEQTGEGLGTYETAQEAVAVCEARERKRLVWRDFSGPYNLLYVADVLTNDDDVTYLVETTRG